MQDKWYNWDANKLHTGPVFATRLTSVSIEIAGFAFLKQVLHLQELCWSEAGLSPWFLDAEQYFKPADL